MKDPTYKRCKCRDDDGKDIGASCPKLRRSDGSLNPRHGTWYFALELPPGPGGKRRPRLRRGGFATQADAERAWEAAKASVRQGGDPAAKVTVGAWLEGWNKNRPDLKPTSHRGYTLIIKTYLDPLLGHIELARLRREDIEEMFAEIGRWNAALAEGHRIRKYQRHVGPAAMQRIRACLRAALTDAEAAGIVGVNVARGKRLKMPRTRRKPLVPWTPELTERFWAGHQMMLEDLGDTAKPKTAFTLWCRRDMRPAASMVWVPSDTGIFLDHVADERLSALFELALYAGLRRGELCGLRWSDIDLADALINVAIERVCAGWTAYDDELKSETARRQVPIDTGTVAVLREHRRRQLTERLAWGEQWTDSGKVFTREDGTPLHPESVTDLFQRLAFAARLPPIRLHDLRHVHISYMLAAGADVTVVRDRAGHTTSTLTRDTYTTVLPEVARDAAEKTAGLIPRKAAR